MQTSSAASYPATRKYMEYMESTNCVDDRYIIDEQPQGRCESHNHKLIEREDTLAGVVGPAEVLSSVVNKLWPVYHIGMSSLFKGSTILHSRYFVVFFFRSERSNINCTLDDELLLSDCIILGGVRTCRYVDIKKTRSAFSDDVNCWYKYEGHDFHGSSRMLKIKLRT